MQYVERRNRSRLAQNDTYGRWERPERANMQRENHNVHIDIEEWPFGELIEHVGGRDMSKQQKRGPVVIMGRQSIT